MRWHDFYPRFTKWSCVVFADCRSIKKLHNQHFGDLFSKMWADDTIRKLKLMQMIFMHSITLDSRNFTYIVNILRKIIPKIMPAHAFLAFLGQLRFWMDTIWVARWNGLKILIPKHMWKSKIWLLEQKLDKNRYVTFF